MGGATVSAATLSWNDLDWVQTGRNGLVLHHAKLTPEQDAQLNDDAHLPDGVYLSCGRGPVAVSITGMFSRMSQKRCDKCCDALGYPRGVGSPKNDEAIRKILGL